MKKALNALRSAIERALGAVLAPVFVVLVYLTKDGVLENKR